MGDLRRRFGQLLAAHRKRRGLTQEALAEAADLSLNMVAKLEAGTSGARFAVIERLAAALEIDPAELFTTEIPSGAINRGIFADLSVALASLPNADLAWVSKLLNVALKPRSGEASKRLHPPSEPMTSTRRRRGAKKPRG